MREFFIKYYFDERVYNAYCKIKPGAFKADLWSYCILYIFGGIYVDIDTLCIGKLNEFIQSNELNSDTDYNNNFFREVIEFVSAVDFNLNINEGQHNLTHGFIAVRTKHPIMLECINRIIYNVENNIITKSKLDFSACGILGRSVNKYLKLPEETSFIGKEGFININESKSNKIYLLKFDEGTEYIKDNTTNKILLQNKNGNSDIINMYNKECEKLSNTFISWVNCNDILN
jgi:mannosyltransferase OCH1-like enzyme